MGPYVTGINVKILIRLHSSTFIYTRLMSRLCSQNRSKKTIIRKIFSCYYFFFNFQKEIQTKFLRYLLDLLKVSIVPLKKRTVKEVASVLSC